MDFRQAIQNHRVIAALRKEEELASLEGTDPTVCFLLFGEINTAADVVKRVKSMGKQVYLHIDLAQGFGNDRAALRYIRSQVQPDGIVSTRTHLIRSAREEGLFAIQRLFIPDTMSVETGKHLLKQSRADAVEVMPGVVPKWVFETLRDSRDIPIVAGGLIRGEDDIRSAFKNGASAVSVSSRGLWNQKV
ncbi:transcriptional regulator [Marinithermofilum abyssi]|uniref:Glycerol uptake operon antiterminator regulatory protein n=1 Tax=Marinithermofilum abyssi TaxID=1571185 RepID=A0A8J2YCK8_9BACL|nr:glycerol-3-phosphate responsive antiterminator [Marinithermofilum abyssi]GGE16933.1 transcriptional regulator [Marinithermofilum abyssi]